MEQPLLRDVLGTDEPILDTTLRQITELDEPTLARLLLSLYRYRHSPKRVRQPLGSAIWSRLAQNRDSLFLMICMAKCLAVLVDEMSEEMVRFFEAALETNSQTVTHSQEAFLWINQVLDLCIKRSQADSTRALMQRPSFFQALQKYLEVFPYKVVTLQIKLINSQLFRLVNQSAHSALLKQSAGALKTNIEVLLAYIEGYTLRDPASKAEETSEKKLALPWDKRRLGHLPLQSLSLKILIDSLVKQRAQPLALTGLGFLVESSPSVLQYLEEAGDIQRLVKEGLLCRDLDKLRLEWFFAAILTRKGKTPVILAEEGYIEHILRTLECKLDAEVLDGEVHSGLTVLRLLARRLKIVTLYMCGNQLVNLVEKLAILSHKLSKRDSYPEIHPTVREYLFFAGNLVLLSSEWKEIAVERVLPHLPPYLEDKTLSVPALQFLKMFLYECPEENVKKLLAAIPFPFLTKRKWNCEESTEFYQIIQNLVCTGSALPEVQSIASWAIAEFHKVGNVLHAKFNNGTLEQSDTNQAAEFLAIISNIAALDREKAAAEAVVSTVLKLADISSQITPKLVWYVTNITWGEPKDLSRVQCAELITVLRAKVGKDKDLDERLKQLATLLDRMLLE